MIYSILMFLQNPMRWYRNRKEIKNKQKKSKKQDPYIYF
jgi:hypothetical protein